MTNLTGNRLRMLIGWKQWTDFMKGTPISQGHFLRMMIRVSVNLRDFSYKGGVMSRYA